MVGFQACYLLFFRWLHAKVLVYTLTLVVQKVCRLVTDKALFEINKVQAQYQTTLKSNPVGHYST